MPLSTVDCCHKCNHGLHWAFDGPAPKVPVFPGFLCFLLNPPIAETGDEHVSLNIRRRRASAPVNSALRISMNNASPKHIVISVIAVVLVFSVLSWLPSPDAKDIGRFFVNCVLCWFLFKGKNWARWILVVLLAVGGSMVALAIAAGQTSIEKAIVLYVMSFSYLVSAGLLALSKSVARYFSAPVIQTNS